METDVNGMQILTCRAGHTFTRTPQVGRPPVVCDEHRLYGAPRPAARLAPISTASTPPPPPAPKGGFFHESFTALLSFLRDGEHVYAFGPSGSGKTEGAKQAAEILFGSRESAYVQSCHPLMNAEDLFGFMGPHGYSPGIAREWLENRDGGILVLDEMDAANPALLVAVNDLLAIDVGRSYRFPDGERFERTANHVIIGAGNTNGLGATSDYVGRSALDRATLSRFAFLPWGYDGRLEMAIAGTDALSIEWVQRVQAIRAIVKDNDLNLLVTPRASIKGARLLRSGMARRDVENAFIFQGADDDTIKTVKSLLRSAAKSETENPLNYTSN